MLPPTQRRDGADNQRDYALSVLLPLKKHDRTGWVFIYEQVARETAGAVWNQLPMRYVCPMCLALSQPTRQGLRPLPCRMCGCKRAAVTFKGIVTVDIGKIRRVLREGGIAVG
jgi:rubredoxin